MMVSPDGHALGSWWAVEDDPPGVAEKLKAVGGRDHRCGTLVHRVNDLGVIDLTEIHRGDRQVSVPELALDDEQRHPLAGHLDRVGMPQLVGREASPYTRAGGGLVQLRAHTSRCQWAPRGRTAQHAKQRSVRERGPELEPRVELFPAQRSIPTSRRLPPLPWRTRIAPRCRSRSLSFSASASLMRSPARQCTTIRPRHRTASLSRPAACTRQ
jgi:hypothetical protein